MSAETRTCLECGKGYEPQPYKATAKTCSTTCSHDRMRRIARARPAAQKTKRRAAREGR